MRRIVIDFDDPLDYTYDSGGMGVDGNLVIGEEFSGYYDELTILNGVTRWRGEFSPPEKAFSAESDYLTIPANDVAFQWTKDFSFEVYIKLLSPLNNNEIRTFWSSGETLNEAQWYARYGIADEWESGTRINFGYYDGVYHNYFSESIDSLVAGPWYHVAITRKDGKLRFFLDGKLLGTRNYGRPVLPIGDFRVGCREENSRVVEFTSDFFDEFCLDNSDSRWTESFLRPQEPNLTPITLTHSGGHLEVRPAFTEINIDLGLGTWEEEPTGEDSVLSDLEDVCCAQVEFESTYIGEDSFPFYILDIKDNIVVRKGVLDRYINSERISMGSFYHTGSEDFCLIVNESTDCAIHFKVDNPVGIVTDQDHDIEALYFESNLDFEDIGTVSWGDPFTPITSSFYRAQITGLSSPVEYNFRDPEGYSHFRGITDEDGNIELLSENSWWYSDHPSITISVSDDVQGSLWWDETLPDTLDQTKDIHPVQDYPDFFYEINLDFLSPWIFESGARYTGTFDSEFPQRLTIDTNEDYVALPDTEDYGGLFVTASDCDKTTIESLGGFVYELGGKYIIRAHWNLINHLFIPNDEYSSPTTLLEALISGGFFTSPTAVEFSEEVQIGYVSAKNSQAIGGTTGTYDIRLDIPSKVYVNSYTKVLLEDNSEFGPNHIIDKSSGSFIQSNSLEDYWDRSDDYSEITVNIQGVVRFSEQVCVLLVRGSAVVMTTESDSLEEVGDYTFSPTEITGADLDNWNLILDPQTDPMVGTQIGRSMSFHVYWEGEDTGLIILQEGIISHDIGFEEIYVDHLTRDGSPPNFFLRAWNDSSCYWTPMFSNVPTILTKDYISDAPDQAISRDLSLDVSDPWTRTLGSFYPIEIPRPVLMLQKDGIPIPASWVGVTYTYPEEYKHKLARIALTDAQGETPLRLMGVEEEFYVFTTTDVDGDPYYGYREFSPNMGQVLVTLLPAETGDGLRSVDIEVDVNDISYTPGDLLTLTHRYDSLEIMKTGIVTENSVPVRTNLIFYDSDSYKTARTISSDKQGRFYVRFFGTPSGNMDILARATDPSTYRDKVSPIMTDDTTDIEIDIDHPVDAIDNTKEVDLDFNGNLYAAGTLYPLSSPIEEGLHGTITVDGEPYEGARVYIISPTTYKTVRQIGTDKQGRFYHNWPAPWCPLVEVLAYGPDNYDGEATIANDIDNDATGVTIDLTEEDHPGIQLVPGTYTMVFLDLNTPDTWTTAQEGLSTKRGMSESPKDQIDSDTLIFNRWALRYDQGIVADSPLGYWRLNETAGPTATDLVNSYDGTYTGTVTYEETGGILDGEADDAVLLDGTSAYISLGNVDDFEIGSFSFEIWIKPSTDWDNTLGADITIASFVPSIYNGWYLNYIAASEYFQLGSGTGGSPWLGINSSVQTLTQDQWYYLVVTYNGTTGKIYLDTTEIASTALATPTWTGTDAYLVGAYSGGSLYLPGTIDEVAFYDSVLTTTQIDTHYETAGY